MPTIILPTRVAPGSLSSRESDLLGAMPPDLVSP